MISRSCSRQCVWLCRAFVLFNIVCLAYLGLRYYNSADSAATRENQAGKEAGRSKLDDALMSGKGWNHLAKPNPEGHVENSAHLQYAQKQWRRHASRSPHRPLASPIHEDENDSDSDGPPIEMKLVEKLRRQEPLQQRHEPEERPDSSDEHSSPKETMPLPPREKKKPPVADEDTEEGKSAGPRQLPVYIVEEHHEVLPYWYNVHEDQSKQQGSRLPPLSLVHIDGHSDGAPIMPDKRYLFTNKFGSRRQIKYLMTSNDNFIMGSKVAGLVSNSVWIYPRWSESEFQNATDVEISVTGISKINGTLIACTCPHYEVDRYPMMTSSINSTDTCYMNYRGDTTRMWFLRKFCYFPKGPFLQVTASQTTVTPDMLSAVLSRRVQLPSKRPERHTMSTLYKQAQTPDDHNAYLLDIDEDFFGVQLAARQLVNANISMTRINAIQLNLGRLFCPSHTSNEVAADRWFVTIAEAVASSRRAGCPQHSEDPECSASAVAQRVAGTASIDKLLKESVCPALPSNLRRPLARKIAQLLADLSQEQLVALQSVGLCLGMSLKTNLDPLDTLMKGGGGGKVNRRITGPEPVVKLCLGHNLPNESAVPEFVDTKQGLDSRLAEMMNILKLLPRPPAAVTICRSSRDGYVPRQQMAYIESGILTALRSVFGQIEVKYDSDLFHGKEGWFDYKEKQLGDRFRWLGEKL